MRPQSRYCEVFAPAKINLGLRILGRRPDGYHDLETIFVAVDLYDHLTFRVTEAAGVKLTWQRPHGLHADDLACGEDNLIVRAVRSIERSRSISANLDIHLVKRIPIAAGLAGGSTDAAATLMALNQLYHLNMSSLELADRAAELGSDVSFFLGRSVAFGTGRGERLQPLDLNVSWWAVLACPHIAVSTKDVYAAFDLTSAVGSPHHPYRLDGEGFFAALGRIRNDLEAVVIRRVPDVLYWRTQLQAMGAEGVYVSGSGPTVFGIFREKPPAARIAALPTDRASIFVVRPVSTPMALMIG